MQLHANDSSASVATIAVVVVVVVVVVVFVVAATGVAAHVIAIHPNTSLKGLPSVVVVAVSFILQRLRR